jgi:hypothetical protein
MYHAALRIRVREVQQALRIDHDRLGAGEERGEMPEVQRLEGPAATRWFHGADVKEELKVRHRKGQTFESIVPRGTFEGICQFLGQLLPGKVI